MNARHGLVGVAAALAVAAAAWWVRRRRAGHRIAAAEARMEPRPVVY
jgi:hypothetical protein